LYHRSKADEVTDERDRQRVLIQITQNLATRIRNSHAFNLPTFYLPHEDDGGLPCNIPNAIVDVCEEIDKVRDVLCCAVWCHHKPHTVVCCWPDHHQHMWHAAGWTITCSHMLVRESDALHHSNLLDPSSTV
jgi:hypothetical protein